MFIGSFKPKLDLTNEIKYFNHYFDGQRFLGINNTNLIISRLSYVCRLTDEMPFSVLDYYVSVLH